MQGVVRNLYVDTYYGRKGDMTPTTGSPSNRIVQPGDQSLDSLLKQAGDGIYVTSWLGGNADSTTGDFSLGLRGHVIENGTVGRPVGEMNVTGNLRRSVLTPGNARQRSVPVLVDACTVAGVRGRGLLGRSRRSGRRRSGS